jgi:hypothetical protein
MRLALVGLFAAFVACAHASGTAAESARTIDLRSYCNYGLTNSLIGTGTLEGPNNLAALLPGTRSFGSVPFDVSGVIQLTGNQAVLAKRNFPEKVEGIKVGSACKRLHLLHGAGWNELENTPIANLVVHYSDGTSATIPIVYGTHVYDWWVNDEKPTDPATEVAWTGANRVSKMFGTDLRVYKTTFANPKPGAVIDHIDFASTKKESAPFLLGLTVE